MPAKTAQETLSLEQLSFAAVASVPVRYDWGQEPGWETVFLPGAACPDCGTVYLDAEVGEACQRCRDDDGSYCYLEYLAADPMVDYYYPLPAFDGEPEQEQEKLVGLPLTLVRLGNCCVEPGGVGFALALTADGQDLSWRICEAYIRLGYAPPLRFAKMPRFADQDNGKEPFWTILKALLLSIEYEERNLVWRKYQAVGTIKATIACPNCGHPDRHNRMGGCEFVVDWEASSGFGGAPYPVQCPCLEYPDRPGDSERVWDTVSGWER